MKAIGVIPARLGSTRLAGKVLLDIAGKPMIQHVWEGASKAKKLSDLFIACDDESIKIAAKKFGAKAVFTSKDHRSGSDRVAEVAAKNEADIIVNIQGDEPLIQAPLIDALVEALEEDRSCQMATVIKEFASGEDKHNPNVVKVVIDADGYAHSFSRTVPEGMEEVVYKHLGMYAYRKDFLLKFTQLPKTESEKREKLEQLRALDNGYQIKTVLTDVEMIAVDTQEDLDQVKEKLENNG